MTHKPKKILSEISPGELLDKITILEIKIENWQNPNSSPKSGVLAKYKKTVQSASQGAITD